MQYWKERQQQKLRDTLLTELYMALQFQTEKIHI